MYIFTRARTYNLIINIIRVKLQRMLQCLFSSPNMICSKETGQIQINHKMQPTLRFVSYENINLYKLPYN